MRVAVTGSTGLIGTALVESLRGDGHEVVRVVRGTSASGDGPSVRWDPAASTIDAAGLERLDAVVHLAGAGVGDHRWTDAYKETIRQSRVHGTTLLAETLAGLSERPPVLVSASGMDYYGDTGDEPATEDSPAGEGFLADVCQAWEASTGWAHAAGIRVAHVRTGIVQSPAGGALKKTLPLFRFGLGGRFGKGGQWWSWISIDDEVGAIRFLIDHEVAGPVNLTAPDPVTNAEYTKTLAKVLRRPAVLPVPSFGPKLLVGAEAADAMLYSSHLVVPAVLEREGYQFRHPTLEVCLRSVLGRR